MKRRKANGKVEEVVADILINNRDVTARELKRDVEKELKKRGYNYRFTERTYLNIKARILPNLGNSPIDETWTIGACIEYSIPSEYISHLLYEQKQRSMALDKWGADYKFLYPEADSAEAEKYAAGKLLTIRQARWFAKLYPFVKEIAVKQYPDDIKKQHNCVAIFARLYAHREHIAESLGKSHPNTKDDLLMEGNLSNEALGDAIDEFTGFAEVRKDNAMNFSDWQGYKKEQYEAILGKLKITQVNMLNEWVRVVVSYSEVEAKKWEVEHKNIVDLVESKGFKFSTLFLRIQSNIEKQANGGEHEESDRTH